MKHRSSLVATAALAVGLTILTGCGGEDAESNRAAAPATPEVRTPQPANLRRALSAPSEARRLANTINTRQATAMAQLENDR